MILTTEEQGLFRPLMDHPQKDGVDTQYKCGVMFMGSWASRLEQHREFCRTTLGKYILKLEKYEREN